MSWQLARYRGNYPGSLGSYYGRYASSFLNPSNIRAVKNVGKFFYNKYGNKPKPGRPKGSKNKPKPAAQTKQTYNGKHVLPAGQRAIRSKSRKAVGKTAGKPLTLQQITDMICPLVREEYQQSRAEITWLSNQQGYQNCIFLDRLKMEQLYGKLQSGDILNQGSLGQVLSNNDETTTIQYTGGYVEYTIINSCNHCIEVLINTFCPKKRHSLTLYECWDKDLLEDNTVNNLLAPVNVEVTKQTYGTPIIQPNNPKSYVKFNFKLVKSKRVVLAVGETYTYKVKKPAFTYDPARERMYQDIGTSSIYDYSPQCYQTSIIGRSQVVVDSTGSKIAHGSGKLAIAEKQVNFLRTSLPNKRYQTFNHGSLDTITNSDQYHYNVDTETETIYTTS